MKITSRISESGFTFVELMATAVVLSLCSLLLYNAFSASLQTFNYCSNYLKIAPWASEKLWQIQNSLEQEGNSDSSVETNGVFTAGQKDFFWQLSSGVTGADSGLYKIDLMLSWKEGRKNMETSRSAYALFFKEK